MVRGNLGVLLTLKFLPAHFWVQHGDHILLFFKCFYLFLATGVFVAVSSLPLVAVSRGYSLAAVCGLLISWPLCLELGL